jgi:hypothetical protein
MLQLIVAGKFSFWFFDLFLTSTQAQSAAQAAEAPVYFSLLRLLRRPSVKLQEPRSVVTPGPYTPGISVSGQLGPVLVIRDMVDFL